MHKSKNKDRMKHSTVAIIGAGSVGSAIAYTLALRNIASNVVLVDTDEKRCMGEVKDLSDAINGTTNTLISKGNYKQASQADIIVIAAGKRQHEGQTRRALLQANYSIIKDILNSLKRINPQAKIIMVTNPVDLLTQVVHDRSGIDSSHIMGSGTLLDTRRLHRFIAQLVGVAIHDIQGYVLAEHGDNQCVAWSTIRIAGKPISEYPNLTQQVRKEIEEQTKNEALEIIAGKGATYYGVASCVAHMCNAILSNQPTIIPASAHSIEYGICLSLLVKIDNSGIAEVIKLNLTDIEKKEVQHAADELTSAYNSIKGSL